MLILKPEHQSKIEELALAAQKVHKVDMETVGAPKAVFYTDGGYRMPSHVLCDPPAVGGFGLFGYFYYDCEPRKGHGHSGFAPTTCGLLNNDQLGGPFGEALLPVRKVSVINYIEAMGGSYDCNSNNSAEVDGIYAALKIIKDTGIKEALIKSDSRYALHGVWVGCDRWSTNGWINAKGQPIPNIDLWKRVYSLFKELRDAGVKVHGEWVKGHLDSKGNVEADRLAGMSMNAVVNNESDGRLDIVDPGDQWNPKVVTHPFITESKLYYDNMDISNEYNGHHFYYLGDPKKLEDDMFGKASSDAMMAVIALPTVEPVLNSLYEACSQFKHYNKMGVFVARIDLAFRPANYYLIANRGTGYFRRNPRFDEVWLPCKTPVIRRMSNQNHGNTGMMEMRMLRDTLIRYMDGSIVSAPGTVVTDITEQLYRKVEKKKKEVTEFRFEATDKVLSVDIEWDSDLHGILKDRLDLAEAVNIPRLRHFKHFAELEGLKVSIITERIGTLGYNYTLVIQSNVGYGIWSGVYANKKILII